MASSANYNTCIKVLIGDKVMDKDLAEFKCGYRNTYCCKGEGGSVPLSVQCHNI